MATKRCHNCTERVQEDETTLVRRKVGGSYRRAAASQPCIICKDCVEGLLPGTSRRGILSVSRWSLHGLRNAGEYFRLEVPERDPEPNDPAIGTGRR